MAIDPHLLNFIQSLHLEHIGDGPVPYHLATHLEVIDLDGDHFELEGLEMDLCWLSLQRSIQAGMSEGEAIYDMGFCLMRPQWNLKLFCEQLDEATNYILRKTMKDNNDSLNEDL